MPGSIEVLNWPQHFWASWGFGLIFVGIDALQAGMGGLQGQINFGQFAGTGLLVKLQLALMGVLFTIITQSSSAGVVAALTALHNGVIDFEQAAALVVGMNVGTTFTSAVATIGGDFNVRRTGFSHVIYNLLVSSGALFLIGPYSWIWQQLGREDASEFALVTFHTAFSLIGVLAVLLFINQYARLMHKIFPDRPSSTQQTLDRGLLKYPELALGAIAKILVEQAQLLAQQVQYMVGSVARPVNLAHFQTTLEQVREYLDAIHLEASAGREWQRLMAAIATLDHLQRLHDRCQNKAILLALRETQELQHARKLVEGVVAPVAAGQAVEEASIQAFVSELSHHELQVRELLLQKIAGGQVELKRGVNLMEALRWLQRVAGHFERIDQGIRLFFYQPASEGSSAAIRD